MDYLLDVTWHGGAEEHHLFGWGAVFEERFDLLLEVRSEEFVSLVQNEKLNIIDALGRRQKFIEAHVSKERVSEACLKDTIPATQL